MIESVKVTNHLGEELTLDLRLPNKTGIFVGRIEGLGPAKSNINISQSATSDGGTFNLARLDVRNVSLVLGFLENPTVEDTRLKVYKYFPISKPIKLTIKTHIRTTEIYGYVESNEPDIFAKQAATRISIVCPDPYVYSSRVNHTVFSGVEPMFQFPFSNESLDENLIMLSRILIDQEQTVLYKGDASVGIVIHIHAIGPVKDISIFNLNTRESMHLDSAKLVEITGEDIKNGDDIIISTIPGDKSVTLLREGIYTNILNCLKKESDWFMLSSGDNVFVYTTSEGSMNAQFRIENRIKYEGV